MARLDQEINLSIFFECIMPSLQKAEHIAGGILVRCLGYFGLSLALTCIIFFPWLNNYFSSDDWPLLYRNMEARWQDIPGWFTGLRASWYRPVHDTFIALCWHMFKLNPVGYRLVSLLLYAFLSVQVGWLAYLTTDNEQIGLLSTVLFTVFATHTEPVLWLAGTNELIAALFVVSATLCFILFRKTGNWLWFGLCAGGCLLGFAAKETSLFLPPFLLITDLLLIIPQKNVESRWRFLPSTLLVLLWAAFLLFRVPLGSAYSNRVTVSVTRLAMNGVYYILTCIFLLPRSYAFVTSWPSWHSSPMLPATILAISSGMIAILGRFWYQNRSWLWPRYKRPILFFFVWTLGAFAPISLIVSERATFLASIGISTIFAILLVGLGQISKPRLKYERVIAMVVTAIYFSLNVFVLERQCMRLKAAADANQTVLNQLEKEIDTLPTNTEILVVDIPDFIEYTIAFGNTFPVAGRVVGYAIPIKPIYDRELVDMDKQTQQMYVDDKKTDNTVVYWYQDGRLVPEQEYVSK